MAFGAAALAKKPLATTWTLVDRVRHQPPQPLELLADEQPDPAWLATGDAADRRVACRPPFHNRWTDWSAACHRTLGRRVKRRRDSSKGNAIGNAWRLSSQLTAVALLSGSRITSTFSGGAYLGCFSKGDWRMSVRPIRRR